MAQCRNMNLICEASYLWLYQNSGSQTRVCRIIMREDIEIIVCIYETWCKMLKAWGARKSCISIYYKVYHYFMELFVQYALRLWKWIYFHFRELKPLSQRQDSSKVAWNWKDETSTFIYSSSYTTNTHIFAFSFSLLLASVALCNILLWENRRMQPMTRHTTDFKHAFRLNLLWAQTRHTGNSSAMPGTLGLAELKGTIQMMVMGIENENK